MWRRLTVLEVCFLLEKQSHAGIQVSEQLSSPQDLGIQAPPILWILSPLEIWGFLHLVSVKKKRRERNLFDPKDHNPGATTCNFCGYTEDWEMPLPSRDTCPFWKRRCTARNLYHITLWLICLLGSLFSTNISTYSLLRLTHNLGSAWHVRVVISSWCLSALL